MANRIRIGDPRGFNKGRSSKFREGSQIRQTPEEGRRTYRPKRCGNNNKDEDNSSKTSMIKINKLHLRNLDNLLFLLIIIKSGRLAEIRRPVCMSKSKGSFCFSFSKRDACLCLYHSFVWSNWNFLHNSQWITLPIQSCLILFTFCANLQHSFIMFDRYVSLTT